MHSNRTFLNIRQMVRLVLCSTLMITYALPRSRLITPGAAPQVKPAAPGTALLQFTAGGHVIGFEASGVYLVARDHALHIEFVNATDVQPLADSSGTQPDLGKASPLGKVTYPELWRGVSVTYQANAGGNLESTYTLAPGAEVNQIRLRFNVPAELEGDGGLRFNFGSGWLSESAPVAWQEVGGTQVAVPVAFELVPGTSLVTFRLGVYDTSLPLVIDPPYIWHTFYGGDVGYEMGYAIAVDSSGSIYLTGGSDSSWLGYHGANPLHPFRGLFDIVVVKLDSSGAYQWHTFYGGANGGSAGYAIGVDGSNNVYVAGYTDDTWRGDGGADPLHATSGGYDIVALKLDASGAYQWHTFYGCSTDDAGFALAVGVAGNVLIAGGSDGSWLGDSGAIPKNAFSGEDDIYVLKLDGNGIYQWHTFYGGSDNEFAKGITVDGSGDIFVTGISHDTWTSGSGDAPINPYNGADDIFVLRLTGQGVYVWHTFFGSASGDDIGRGIALDGNGHIFVTGDSDASWSGGAGQAPLHSHSGSDDIVVLKLLTDGTYMWHTFYGASADDRGYAVALGGAGNVLVMGASYASWQGENGEDPIHAYLAGSDIVVLKLNSDGAYLWHTFYGSPAFDLGNAIAVDGSANVYLAGYSYNGWYGDSYADPLNAYSGGASLWALKLGAGGAYQWHTFYGPPYGEDSGKGIAVDGSGNIYWTGSCDSNWLGDKKAEPLHPYSGGPSDIVVVKLNSRGEYQWHTFYGSFSNDEGDAIAVDGSGNVYITGVSYDTWQGDSGAAPIHPYSGNRDIVVLKLNDQGVYQWHTFYGSAGDFDYGKGIAVDGSGNVYITGISYATWQGDGGEHPIHAYSAGWEIFVLKLNSSGVYQWHTFYGGSDYDRGLAIALDGNSNIYVSGDSVTTWQGDNGEDPIHAISGYTDIMVLKLNSDGVYRWHTFYGAATENDYGYAIAVDRNANVYITGVSGDNWQGDNNTDPIHTFSGAGEIVVVKLISNGAYQWHTFYGGSGYEQGSAIAVDASGNVYVAGFSDAAWLGDGGAAPSHAYNNEDDIMALELNSSGAYQWHTFYGCDTSFCADIGSGIAVDKNNNIYVVGDSNGTWQGDGGAKPLHAYSGASDVVVLKFGLRMVNLPLVVK